MALFNETQRKKIAETVARAELNTAGELVVVHARRSDDYGLNRGGASLAFSLLVAGETHHYMPQLDFSLLLLEIAILWGFGYLLCGAGAVLRALVPARQREGRVMERALQAFSEEGVSNTRDRSGVLIFLSEAERRVVILADSGINDRVDAGDWEKDVKTLTAALRSGAPESGLVEVIERIGGVLAEAFPAREDDQNELPDELRER